MNYLRKFQMWDDSTGYDFVGMVNLFGACLDNLRRFATKEELAEMREYMEPHQWAFLEALVDPEKRGGCFPLVGN